MAKYIFPVRGLYNFDLSAVPKDGSAKSDLKYSQRVSRGTVAVSGPHGWPKVLVILMPLVLLAALIVAFNNRGRIMKWSKAKSGKVKS